ncbi:MAG: hypothetical protein NC929_05200, partial [Candidatus Omnitrophica bacterium]|nr:hypothetical protein [Candidatus Omnitrophota bacterium]
MSYNSPLTRTLSPLREARGKRGDPHPYPLPTSGERKEVRGEGEPMAKEKRLSLDLTSIINEPGKTLKNRFEQLINDSEFFDCLVAYFYISGFYSIYKALEKTEKIRVLIGIGTTEETYDLIKKSDQLSHLETKQI